MDTEYLRSSVGDLLAAGVSATLLQNPNDPVEFLAKWLLHQIQVATAKEVQATELCRLLDEDAQFEREQQLTVEARRAQSQQKAAQTAAERAALARFLADHSSLSSLFSGFFNVLSPLVHVDSMYTANVDTTDAESPVLRFEAATPSDEHLLEKKLVRTEGKGIVFSLFDDNSEEENIASPEGEDDESEPRVEAAVPVLPSLFMPNVRVGPKAHAVHFFSAPRSGSFLALRFRWQSVLSEASFDDALERIKEREERNREEAEAKAKADEEAEREPVEEAEEEEEEEEEDIDEDDEEAVKSRDARRAERAARKSAPPKIETLEEKVERLERETREKAEQEDRELLAAVAKRTVNQAVCFDTLKSGARIVDEDVAFIAEQTRQLLETTIRIDRAQFKMELASYQRFHEWQVAYGAKAEEEREAKDEDAKQSRAKIKEERKAAGQPHSAQDVELVHAAKEFSTLTEALELQCAALVLRGGGVEAWQAALLLTGYDRKIVGDWEWRTQWSSIRQYLDAAFSEKLLSYQPRADEDETKEKQAKAFVAAVDAEKVKERNAVTAAVLAWVKAAIDVRKRVRKERKQENERRELEEAERIAREEEEKRKREEEEEADKDATEGEEEEEEEES